MTAPNQPAPNTLETMLGIGHFEMGGGDTNFGQGIDENFVTDLVTIPFANLGNMLQVLADVLLKLPAEALKAFESLIPGGFGGDGSVGSMVGQILGILDPRKAVQTVEDFLAWVGNTFEPLAALTHGLSDNLDRVITFIRRIVDAIVTGIRGIPFFGDPIADAIAGIPFNAGLTTDHITEIVDGVASVIGTFRDNTQQSAETLSSFFNQPRLLPPWVGALSDDVAFDVDKIDGTTAPTLGQVVLIPVKVIQGRVCDAIKFGISATTMTNCYVGLYDCDETTGGLTKVLDLGDCKSQLDTAFNQQTIHLPTPIGVQRGEIFYVGVLQVGGTAAAMHRSSSATNFTTGLFPRYRGNVYATGSQTSLPSTIVVADVSSGTRFWGALGTAADPVTPGSILVSDSFTRPDGSLGAAWSDRAGAFIIVSNQSRASSVPAATTFNTRLSSLSQRVGFTHATPITAISRYGVSLRGNGLGAYVALHPERLTSTGNLTATIRTHAAYGDAGTTRATYAGPSGEFGHGVVGDWIFEAVGNVYSGYRNGILLLQWTDSGSAFSVGAGNTEVGLVAYSGDSANRIDNWFAQDL